MSTNLNNLPLIKTNKLSDHINLLYEWNLLVFYVLLS